MAKIVPLECLGPGATFRYPDGKDPNEIFVKFGEKERIFAAKIGSCCQARSLETNQPAFQIFPYYPWYVVPV